MNSELHSMRPQYHSPIYTVLLKQLLIGSSDGLVIATCLLSAISVLVSKNGTIITTCIIANTIGAITMAVSAYFSAKDKREYFAEKTPEQKEQLKKLTAEKTLSLFKKLHLDEVSPHKVAEDIESDQLQRQNHIEAYKMEQGMTDVMPVHYTALSIGLAYALAGLLPLIPFFYDDSPKTAFGYSCLIAFFGLLLLGYFKSSLNGASTFWGTLRLMAMGTVAAVLSFLVARIFE